MLKEKFLKKWNYYLPDWKQRVRQAQIATRKWKQSTNQLFFSLLIHFAAVVLLYAFLLSSVNYFWFVIRDTQVGLEFARHYSSSPFFHLLTVLRKNTLYLSFRLSLDVVVHCFVIGLALQVIPIRRYFYDAAGMGARLLWFLVFAALTALNIPGYNYALSLQAGIALYLFPVCCLLSLCLHFSAKWLPEITVLSEISRGLREIVRVARIRNQDVI